MAVTPSTGSASPSRSSDRSPVEPGADASTLSIGPASRAYLDALADLTERWERGEAPGVEQYLEGRADWTASQAVELIYREYRLAEYAGRRPSIDAFLARFPEHRPALERLLTLDGACSDSLIQRLFKTDDEDDVLPRAGDEIGPFVLKRELGRGGFARVFLAEQADLEYRLVVVKVSTKPTREPWLLARARHPNIVEIVSHAEVDDGALQMICMPFRGGAPLSAILARRRVRPKRWTADRRLLDDLDAEAAPEHPAARPARSARETIAATTDVRAFAWIAARLAEALDHAYDRGVAHGDVKPSNILLTADAEPMLLDFNLARDWSLPDPEAHPADPGGTLAYMAPERLRLIAETARRRPIAEPEALTATAADPHRADVYALGVVLLEAVSGWSPAAEVRDSRRVGRQAFAEAAERYAEVRERGAVELVRRAELAGGGAIPPTLRSILVHCLEADPSARYGRGDELAEDLDRWLADRRLRFAPEPSRRRALGRWARRNRRRLAVASIAAALSAVTAAAVVVQGNRTLAVAMMGRAVDKLALTWDDVASPAFHGQRPGFPATRGGDSVEEVRKAMRALKEYKILDAADWRAADDFRCLPAADRDDLELWLIEQTFRVGRALADRPASPDDWERARSLIDRVCGSAAPRVLAALRDRLDGQLAAAGAPAHAQTSSAGPAAAVDPGVEAYLEGVAAELSEDESADRRRPGVALWDPRSNPWAGAGGRRDDAVGLAEALGHYRRLLAVRPDSFWGRYRSATITFRMGRWAEAADDIQTCLARRPANPVLHGFLAACLFNLDRSTAALEAGDRAVAAAPDHADFVQTRAFIRSGLPSDGGLEDDIRRYEMLKNLIPESFFRSPTPMDLANLVGASTPASRRGMPLARPRRSPAPPGGSSRSLDDLDPGELTARAVFAARLRESGKEAIAAGEIDKILAIDPGYIVARVVHMCLAIDGGRFVEARDDLDQVLDDPRLAEYVASTSQRGLTLLDASRQFAFNGEFREAVKLARTIVDLMRRAGGPMGRAYYTLAQVEALAARTEPRWISDAAKQLRQAIRANPGYERWFLQDEAFAPVRPAIRAALDAMGR